MYEVPERAGDLSHQQGAADGVGVADTVAGRAESECLAHPMRVVDQCGA